MQLTLIPEKERIEWVDDALRYGGRFLTRSVSLRQTEAFIECSCGSCIGNNVWNVGSDYILSYSQKLSLFLRWCTHIVYHIRMNGCKEHLELFWVMCGENSENLLKVMADKNRKIATIIDDFIIQKCARVGMNETKR